MKTWLNKSGLGVFASIIIGLAACLLGTGSAQTTPPAPPDSIVQVTAESKGLGLADPLDINDGGTFWVMQPDGISAPWPCQPQDTNLPVYQIAERQFLVDSTGGMVATNTETPTTIEAALAAQVDSVVKLVDWLQGVEEIQNMKLLARAMGMNLPDFGDEDEGGGFTNRSFGYSFDTNSLWIQVSSNSLTTPDYFSVEVMNTTEGQSYDILVKSNLLAPVWVTELVVTGAVGSVTPVQLPMNQRQNLFVRARTSISFPFYVTSPPLSQDVLQGDSVTFRVETGGITNLAYQWTFNGIPIPGATNNTYTIYNVQPGDAGNYAVILSDGTDAFVTAAAQLTVEAGTGIKSLMYVLGQRQDYIFKRGVTYNIGSQVQLHGKTTIEGGAVIKFDTAQLYPSLQILGTLDCTGKMYDPAILTSIEDNTYGLIEGYTAVSPVFTGVPFLDLTEAGNVAINNLRFRYADMAVSTPTQARLDIWNCQFYQCGSGVINDFGGVDSFHNVLLVGCQSAVWASTNTFAIEMEHVTAAVSNVWISGTAPVRVGLTNSILLGQIGTALSYSAPNCASAPDPANFQTNVGANYYLASNSSLRQAGTVNVSPRLLEEFHRKTTGVPIDVAAFLTVKGQLMLYPQVPRYTNGAPDLGYYYDALDYTVAGLTISGGSVTVGPGTAIGLRNDYMTQADSSPYWNLVGFYLTAGSSLVSQGTAANPISYVSAQQVQEGPFIYPRTEIWDNRGIDYRMVAFMADNASDMTGVPIMNFRFSNFYLPAEDYQMWSGTYEELNGGEGFGWTGNSSLDWQMRDCQVHGGQIVVGDPWFYNAPYPPGSVTWDNNLFEQVNVVLNPNFYWNQGWPTNTDFRFVVRNNLFRGSRLVVQSRETLEGNWQINDNLFDKVAFQYYSPNVPPLDHDHNCYWPLRAVELDPGQTTGLAVNNDDGGMDAANDQILNNAPPYANGPLGEYYLSSVTPLYQAGSRTADDAGLTQYTTMVNQTKDVSGQPVNIGLHYVAETNSLPMDSDGDGVPDYVEVEHGTDLNNAMTDGVTNDTYNVAYDDVDLSGNGLVGRIKKALGLNPLDTSNPLTLRKVTTGEEPDIATFEIPVNFALATNIGKLNLLVDGNPVSFVECDPNTNGQSRLTWNTTFNPPGYHTIQPQLVLNTLDPTIAKASGQFSALTVDNGLQFDPFYSVYDDSHGATLYAKTPTCPDASFTIEIQTTNGNHIKTFTGNTSSGEISAAWNLTDDDENPVTNGSVNAVFNITLLNIGSYTHTLNLNKVVQENIPEEGEFTVAYAWNNAYEKANSLRFWVQNLIVDQLLMPCNVNFCYDHRYSSSFNDWTGNSNPQGVPGVLSDQSAANLLLTNLSNGNFQIPVLQDPTRNFFFFGHGSSAVIGDNVAVSIAQQQVANATGNNNFAFHRNKGKWLRGWAYRFVFLDACDTSDDMDWAHCFGIDDQLTSAQLANWPERAQAFVGWDGEQLLPDDKSDMYNAINVFFCAWQSGMPLNDCIYYASQYYPSDPFSGYYLPWNFGPSYQHYTFSERKIHGPKDPRLVIYGYAGLTRTGFQPGYDQSSYYKK